ncbi:uncharacterized protein CcaverHIS019_0212250 [Cutaneotrichosporon cavernicola]|uniref:Uncharacterized protein n=1 Tax=Cutaneotrichosporon cavernicola TaxID=279322 RepID=A0AA48IG98_9TREE|nr:uncharacterized protein CcaverHIS019_0212250 [Cutaneotrichosporon cavernicola]BEI89863.1 hypothetical protein CcaverHIS019_0212250 [Cutaneotrichosporon cavernicola]BEI97633.1 hypothetical protein CcaverHIS631_0212220 [Cutaneotrichosporon cavernicola]BEJ05411.1 hypothetical protein CcaverHIS641_0212280 [Cutaneotrichosporon cavernicola]
MSIATSIKSPLALFTHVIVYGLWILSIIQITKYKDMYGQGVHMYVPVVVAICTMASLQVVYHVIYWISNSRPLFSVGKMMVSMVFFAFYAFGTAVALTVQRHDFCPTPPVGYYPTGAQYGVSDCQGVIRGMMGLTWAVFICDLLYIGYLVTLSRYGMATPVGKAGEIVVNPDEEKAPVH